MLIKLFPPPAQLTVHVSPFAAASRLLSDPRVCTAVLERGVSDRFCSLSYAQQTKDWSGHFRQALDVRGGGHDARGDGQSASRWHPQCTIDANSSKWRKHLHEHTLWFGLVRFATRRLPSVELNFSDAITRRAATVHAVQALSRSYSLVEREAHAAPRPWEHEGVCETTRDGEGARCRPSDAKGSWILGSLGSCRARCEQCAQCRFISWSEPLKECSWFARCELDRLRDLSTGHLTFAIKADSHAPQMVG